MDQTQRQPQLFVQRQGHAGRNLTILFFLAVIFFAVPFVNVESVSIGVASVSVTGSLSYTIFHCGELHLTGSSVFAVIDRYEWVCGNQPSLAR